MFPQEYKKNTQKKTKRDMLFLYVGLIWMGTLKLNELLEKEKKKQDMIIKLNPIHMFTLNKNLRVIGARTIINGNMLK